MLIRDALYGPFELPAFLERLVLAPEFRRLSEIRLLNINSASLAGLADVSRYSHTLGVLRLALLNPLVGLGENELKAFLASIVVHDAGTPAFAHLFEYFLSERYGWDHESVVSSILTGTHHPDQHAHQIFRSHTPNFKKLCCAARVDFDLVLEFVRRRHRYSRLIFGSLDLDNLDNVARMTWMMGHHFDLACILRLAGSIGVDQSGQLQLPITAEEDVQTWLRLRSSAYEVLVFDGPTVAGQAVLSKVISLALDEGQLDLTDWHYDDKSLLDALMDSPATKKKLQADFFGQLPGLCLLYVARGDNLRRLNAIGRDTIVALIEEFLRDHFGPNGGVYGHIFRDRGTFAKRVDFVDPPSGQTWSVGKQSASLIMYGFIRRSSRCVSEAEQTGKEFGRWILSRI
jgi:HD superfamily phosphohydrolase